MKTLELTLEDGEGNAVTFKVAPTPLSKIAPHVAKFEKGFDASETIDALLGCVFAGAKRAKAAITLEWLSENVDLHNRDEVMRVFMEVNGFKAKVLNAAGDTPEGEAQAAGAP